MSHLEDAMQTMITTEFMLEPGLPDEFRIGKLLSEGGQKIAPAVAAFLTSLAASHGMPVPAGITKEALLQAFKLANTTLAQRAIADIIATLRSAGDKYASCCRSALSHAVIGSYSYAFGALRVAAGVDDRWARHHHIYGLIHGAEGNSAGARFELGIAAAAEPYPAARQRVSEALALVR